MLHSIFQFALVHRYLTATVLALVAAVAFVQGGQSSLERSAAAWQQAHAERMAVVDR
ncbi:hypothetical protein [Endothiovibrio diazotrophicus]